MKAEPDRANNFCFKKDFRSEKEGEFTLIAITLTGVWNNFHTKCWELSLMVYFLRWTLGVLSSKHMPHHPHQTSKGPRGALGGGVLKSNQIIFCNFFTKSDREPEPRVQGGQAGFLRFSEIWRNMNENYYNHQSRLAQEMPTNIFASVSTIRKLKAHFKRKGSYSQNFSPQILIFL